MTRSVAIAIVLVVAAIAYVALLRGSSKWDFPAERSFGDEGLNVATVHVYLEPIGINSVAESIQVRVSVASTKAGDEAPVSEHDLYLLLEHDNIVERIDIRAHQPAPSRTIDLDLSDGDVRDYPLDTYHAALSVRGFLVSGRDAPATLAPVRVTVWQRVLGFRLQTKELPAGAQGASNLAIEIHRNIAIIFFVLAAYGAMALLALGALTIGTLVFLKIRRPEPTLTGALAGIVFALPALRNALPGGAPLGVSADIFVFLWAELAAVLAITMLIAMWARTGPRP